MLEQKKDKEEKGVVKCVFPGFVTEKIMKSSWETNYKLASERPASYELTSLYYVKFIKVLCFIRI